MLLSDLAELFCSVFASNGDDMRFFHAPGRVNLIGEHTDYNGGHVFPCALSLGTYGAIRRNDSGMVRVASGNDSKVIEFRTSDISYSSDHGWANYPKGVLSEFALLGHAIEGFDMYVSGDIPSGAGLSSSASLEMCVAISANSLFGWGMDLIDMALLCQRAENRFIGVNCGIMDQFASAMGKKDKAILLNCQTLDYTYVTLAMTGHKLVITNTNKKRGLADSKYNERRSECETALSYLQAGGLQEMSSLCQFDPEMFENLKHKIPDATIQKRAKHAIYENARALQAVDALNRGDVALFGDMMNQSHISLRDDYEVTGLELDVLAQAAWEIDGVVGSRMTGAGFGGCTVSIVREDALDDFKSTVASVYTQRTGLMPSFYEALTGDGARELF